MLPALTAQHDAGIFRHCSRRGRAAPTNNTIIDAADQILDSRPPPAPRKPKAPSPVARQLSVYSVSTDSDSDGTSPVQAPVLAPSSAKSAPSDAPAPARKASLAAALGSLKHGLRPRGAKPAAGSSGEAAAAAVADGPLSRRQALKAQSAQASGTLAASAKVVRRGYKFGTEWEQGVGPTGGDLAVDAARRDRWMLLPHEAAAAVRAGEDLSWMAMAADRGSRGAGACADAARP